MFCKQLIMVLTAISLLAPFGVHAEENSWDKMFKPIDVELPSLGEREQSKDKIAVRAIKLLAGMATSIIIHEVGHEVVARFEGVDLHWSGPNWECYDCQDDIEEIAIAGLGAQALTSEILLARDEQNDFTRGILLGNIINPFSYMIKNRAQDGYGDLANYNDDQVVWIELTLTAHTLSVLKRWIDQDWSDND